MSSIRSSVIRVVARVASAPEPPEALLASVGLAPYADPMTASKEMVDAEAYYGFLERAALPDDHGMPYRYAEALSPDEYSALGLALKTADTLRDSLRRLSRYIVLLSDTLDYELIESPQSLGDRAAMRSERTSRSPHARGGDALGDRAAMRSERTSRSPHARGGDATLVMVRPHHRRGATLANECALAATTSILRAAAGRRVTPQLVTFRHDRPDSIAEAHSFFGCPVGYGARHNSIEFDAATLDTRAKLADPGLSSFLLAHLDQLRSEQADRSLVSSVHATITDALPDGLPKKSVIARRLGMSERTLHRRLADHGESFQSLVTRSRREAAEALLADERHSIAEVAFLTGFADQSSFQRAFKSWTGSTPLGFRGVRRPLASAAQSGEA